MRGMEIDYETADRITLLSLKDQLNYLEEELRAHVEDGQWMHPEDVVRSRGELIPALKTLIAHYGG
jgi:hypothetical protein